MNELGLTNLVPTNIILHVADQRRVKPLGIVQGIKIIVVGLEFIVNYLVVRPYSYGASFPILAGRPWLLQACCVHNWYKGTITIGPRTDGVQLQVVSKEFLRESNNTLSSIE